MRNHVVTGATWGAVLGAIVAAAYTYYDVMVLGSNMFGLLIPLAFAGVVGAVGGAVPGTLVGLFVGVLLTRIRGGPNDSSE